MINVFLSQEWNYVQQYMLKKIVISTWEYCGALSSTVSYTYIGVFSRNLSGLSESLSGIAITVYSQSKQDKNIFIHHKQWSVALLLHCIIIVFLLEL